LLKQCFLQLFLAKHLLQIFHALSNYFFYRRLLFALSLWQDYVGSAYYECRIDYLMFVLTFKNEILLQEVLFLDYIEKVYVSCTTCKCMHDVRIVNIPLEKNIQQISCSDMNYCDCTYFAIIVLYFLLFICTIFFSFYVTRIEV
jgi:hypothetical protein